MAATPEPRAPVATRSGCEQYRQLVSDYSWNVDVALAIMKGESSCRADAVGDKAISYYANGRLEGVSCGLMQVRVLAGRPSCEELQDPATNIAWAYKISGNGATFRPWSVYTNGAYLKYL